MLKVILNRLKPQAEEIIAEKQAGFRAERNTTEQIFILRILCEKYLQHQKNLYHVFIDFKKALDRVWHAALWATMRKYNISANLVGTIEQLYDKDTSAVQINCSIGEWFRTTVGVRQRCLLSPTLFNIFSNRSYLISWKPGYVAQSIGHLTRKSGVPDSIPGLATYFCFSFRFFKKGSWQLLAKVCARNTG